MRLVVHESASRVATEAAARIAEIVSGLDRRLTIGLAGGSTPKATYLSLLDHDLPWSRVDAWLSDERWVPHEDERCNGLMATTTLLNHVDATFHRPRWSDRISPGDAAAHYEAELRVMLRGEPPDLILLGLGADGHTASLFPGTRALAEKERWIVANEVPALGEVRITATYPLLWQAKHVLFLTTGEAKAVALRESLTGETPAGRVVEGDGEIEWHVDRAAASQLP